MTTTYGTSAKALLLPILLLGLAWSQSLEERALESRRMQAHVMAEADSSVLDSIMKARKQSGVGVQSTAGLAASTRRPATVLDSLISGPKVADSSQALETDTVWVEDSLGLLRPKVRMAKPILKRYEQRIFRDVDAAAFSSAAGSAGRGYILGAGDEISVSLWGDKEKQYALTLNADGKIFMEGVGVVALAGNNLDEAQKLLRDRLAKVYSGIGRGTMRVEVSLGRAGPIRVFVLGEVKVPGGYVFTGRTSVLSALYFAKGPTDIGTVRNIQLTRSGAKHSLDLYRYLLKGESLHPHSLQDGDILFAGRAEALVSIEGAVGRPAVYELKKGEGVKELLEFAGGLDNAAADHRLTMQRYFPDGKLDYVDLASPRDFLSGKARMELQDGDRVKVARSTEGSRNYLVINGPVKYPGTYESTGTTTVEQLIARAGGLRDDAYLGRIHIVRFHPDSSSSLMAYSLDSVVTDSIRLLPRDRVILYSIKDMYKPDSVQISGAVVKPGKYEFREGMTAKDLAMLAGGFLPHHKAGRALVFRGNSRERKVEEIQLGLEDGLAKSEPGFRLQATDLVQIPVDPKWYQKEVVTLDGLFMNPGKFALLHPGEKLSSVVQRAGGFRPDAYVEGGRFYRSRDSVGRVGVDIRQAIRKPRSKSNIGLVHGDSIFIPERLNTVKVMGEVGFETSLLYKEGATVEYYIERAGGFTRRSERNRVVVQYANGETARDGYFNRKPDAGSVIYVPKGPEPKPVDMFAGINAILGTLGVVVALILSIQAISKN